MQSPGYRHLGFIICCTCKHYPSQLICIQEYVDMREKRGQRFNITDPPKTVSEDELKLLYER